MSKITSIGGQALLEGVMMVGPKKTVAAFCSKTGEISTKEIEAKKIKDKFPIAGKPFLRGLFSMIDSMKIGMNALEISADKAMEDEDVVEESSKFEKWLEKKFGDSITKIVTAVGAILGVGLSVLLFFFLPALAFNGILFLAGENLSPFRSLFEGVIRVVILISYMLLISLMPDIKRLFMYHGAEHKTIFCYEAELDLSVENVRKQKRFHPRCGTSFLVILIGLGIIVGFFIPFENVFLRTAAKVLCLPLVICVGYELIKLCGKYNNFFTRMIAAPGMWVQRITTKEPTDKMIETAIAAMVDVIPEDGEDLI